MPGAGLYLRALRALAPDRPLSVGFGAVVTGQIPFASLVAFASRYGIDDLGEFDSFVAVMQAIDIAETAVINEKNNKKT